jgi:hypothetical protein
MKAEFRIEPERQIGDGRTAMSSEVIQVRSARRENVIVVAERLEKPPRAQAWVPRVVREVIEALDFKASDDR